MLSVTILGNGSALPSPGRYPTAQYLQNGYSAYIIDCGEGTQQRLMQYALKPGKISRIFISHLHGDHYFGLIGLLTSMALTNRTNDIHIFGPAELKNIIDIQLNADRSPLPYHIYFHALDNEGEISNDAHTSVYAFRVEHSIECWGFRFTELKNARSVDAARAMAYGVPLEFYSSLQKGYDYVNARGTIVPNTEVTMDAPRPKSYAFCADTLYSTNFIDKIKDVDLLYHETTFLDKDSAKAAQRFHSTTRNAAEIAQLANAKKLLIGHFSSRYENLNEFLNECRAIFPATELSVGGATYFV